jgi:hypothetical protein
MRIAICPRRHGALLLALHFGALDHDPDMTNRIKIFTVANVPEELQQEWLQHLRNFDTAHPNCHFEVGIDGPDIPMREMIDRIRLSPGLTFEQIWERTKWERPQ